MNLRTILTVAVAVGLALAGTQAFAQQSPRNPGNPQRPDGPTTNVGDDAGPWTNGAHCVGNYVWTNQTKNGETKGNYRRRVVDYENVHCTSNGGRYGNIVE